MQQRRILDDQRVGLEHRLAQADLLVVDAAERHDRRAHPLGAEARKRLRVATLVECGHRQELGAGHDALSAAAMNANLEHRVIEPALRRFARNRILRPCIGPPQALTQVKTHGLPRRIG